MAMLISLVFMMIVSGLLIGLWQVIPGEVSEEGKFTVHGVTAIPYVIVGLGGFFLNFWMGLCVTIKRYHDRNKSGWWILIQLVPLVGPIWYLIDVGFLRGTSGDNRFGPDPLAAA
ncbi:MAG: DUF805 domain-containing protein [Alphaproteobacteria bacterium]|nr:DUF805 domain-containing protein [Alphaproteobacteria bacterium]